jgi:hypothetical protein
LDPKAETHTGCADAPLIIASYGFVAVLLLLETLYKQAG